MNLGVVRVTGIFTTLAAAQIVWDVDPHKNPYERKDLLWNIRLSEFCNKEATTSSIRATQIIQSL